jgi:uncharacterized alkaline shock family protein YloU
MKNGFWDRVLIFFYVLLTVALTVLVALQVFGVDLIAPFYNGLEGQAPGIVWKLIVCGIGAIVVLLGVFVLVAIMPAKKARREFITLTNDENGQVRIALPALREMAAQAVGDAAGVKDMAVDISDAGDAITVAISLDIVSGTHVPTVTMSMQRAVRSYIQMNCGVAVKDVSVVISSVLPAPEGAKPVSAPVEEPVAMSAPAPAPAGEPEPAPVSEAPVPEEREVVFEPEILPDEAHAEPEDSEEAAESDDEAVREKAE